MLEICQPHIAWRSTCVHDQSRILMPEWQHHFLFFVWSIYLIGYHYLYKNTCSNKTHRRHRWGRIFNIEITFFYSTCIYKHFLVLSLPASMEVGFAWLFARKETPISFPLNNLETQLFDASGNCSRIGWNFPTLSIVGKVCWWYRVWQRIVLCRWLLSGLNCSEVWGCQ